jgi:hypothetical protein
MNTSNTLIIALSIVVAGAVVGFLSRPQPQPEIGRYQVIVGKHAFVIDTVTGETWQTHMTDGINMPSGRPGFHSKKVIRQP